MAYSMTATGPAEDTDSEHAKLKEWFESAEQTTQDARKLSERDTDYYNNLQWTAEELGILRKRKQPAITENYIQRKVDFLLGYEMLQRTDPKALPRTPKHEDEAHSATDALRFVGDWNIFDEVRSEVWKEMLVPGFGGAEVTVAQGPGGRIDVTIKQIPWDRLFYDPHSRKPDFSDARYVGMVVWLDYDEAATRYPDRADILDATIASASTTETYDDRPKWNVWADGARRRVRIVEIQYRHADGKWCSATFTAGGFLVEPHPSPYLDENGHPESCLALRSAYVDRENNRYGHVRSLISRQDSINKRESKLLHLASVRQTYGNAQAVADVDAVKSELAKPDGHVELTMGGKFGEDFGILPTADMAAAQMQLLQFAIAEMQVNGPNAAMSGKDPRQQSGRAIMAQQQGGMTELKPLMDGLTQWTRQIYRMVWNRIRQYWTGEVWVRVTDDEKNLRWVGINRQVTVQDELAAMPEDQRAMAMQQMQLMPGDPRLEQVLRVENRVADLDVDITVEEGPDLATLQSETFQSLTEMFGQIGPVLSPAERQVWLEAILRAAPLRNKDDLLEKMEEARNQPPPEGAQRQQQIAEAGAMAEVEKTQAETEETRAKAQATSMGAQVSMLDAQARVRSGQVESAATVADTRIAAFDAQARAKAADDANRIKAFQAMKPAPQLMQRSEQRF